MADVRPTDVVGESEDGESAIDAIATLRPQVVLLVIQLPGIDGLDVVARVAGTADEAWAFRSRQVTRPTSSTRSWMVRPAGQPRRISSSQ